MAARAKSPRHLGLRQHAIRWRRILLPGEHRPTRDNPYYEGAAGNYFVGRDDDVHIADARIAAVADGQTRAISVPGYSGLGKTPFIYELVERASDRGVWSAGLQFGFVMADEPADDQLLEILTGVWDDVECFATEIGVGELRLTDTHHEDLRSTRESGLRVSSAMFVRIMRKVVGKISQNGGSGLLLVIDQAENLTPRSLQALRAVYTDVERLLIVLGWRLRRSDFDGASIEDNFLSHMRDLSMRAAGDEGTMTTFTQTTLAMRQFRTLDEARRCITVRLPADMSVADGVVNSILAITRLRPRRTIQLCHHAFDRADCESSLAIEDRHLAAAIRIECKVEWNETEAAISESSDALKDLFLEVIRLGGDCSIPDLMRELKIDSEGPRRGRSSEELLEEFEHLSEVCDGGTGLVRGRVES